MIKRILSTIIIAFLVLVAQATTYQPITAFSAMKQEAPKEQKKVLAEHTISLDKRYGNTFVNDVFRDNILLNLFYLAGEVKTAKDIDWDTIREPFTYDLVLKPGEVFAYHEDVLPQFSGKVVATTNAHFGQSDGFKTDGLLYGDGVCHFASLINWVARDANLDVTSPTNHNFANIPEIDAKYGTAIYYMEGSHSVNAAQNLYVKNNRSKPVHIVFASDAHTMKVTVYEEK